MKADFSFAILPAFLCLVFSLSSAQQVAPPDQKIVVVRAAHMLDVKSGRTIDNPILVITGDKITSVSGTAPTGATVIDLPGATLVPGLIDAHTHLIGKGTNFGYQRSEERRVGK